MNDDDDDDELALINSVEHGTWQSVNNLESLKNALMLAATETATKDTRINIRIAKRDVSAIKTKALEQGIPYQTLIASVLHKYASGQVIEK
jgi:predicted DNA binding CopG/RHH family protein